MNDNERAMKYFIIFALGSAVILPCCGEVFANISHGAAFTAVAIWTVAAGIKFSSLPVKSAMLGITAFFFSSVILSLIGYVIIHPAVKNWLTANSVYFDLSLTELVSYWGRAVSMLIIPYLVFFARLGVKRSMGKLEDNGKKAASAVDNAFDDDDSTS